MENETQDTLISIISKRLDKFEDKLNTVASVDECKDLRGKIDDHCLRLRAIEKEKAVKDMEITPIIKNWENLNIRVDNIATLQKVEASKIAYTVGAVTFILTLAAQYLWNLITNNK